MASDEDVDSLYLLEVFHSLFVKYVTPSHIIPHLTSFIDTDILADIKNKEKRDRRAAITELLDELKKCKKYGWFKNLKDALNIPEYKTIYKQLNNEDVKDEEIHKRIIKENFVALSENMNYSELLAYFKEKGTLGRITIEKLMAEERNCGSIQANVDLLFALLHQENTFGDLMYALINAGYLKVVREIAPDFCGHSNYESVQQCASDLRKDLGQNKSSGSGKSLDSLANGLRRAALDDGSTEVDFKKQKTVGEDKGCTLTTFDVHYSVEPSQDLQCGQDASSSSTSLGTDSPVSRTAELSGIPRTPPTAKVSPISRAAVDANETELLKKISEMPIYAENRTELPKLSLHNSVVDESQSGQIEVIQLNSPVSNLTPPILNLHENYDSIDNSIIDLKSFDPNTDNGKRASAAQVTPKKAETKENPRTSESSTGNEETRIIRGTNPSRTMQNSLCGNDRSQAVSDDSRKSFFDSTLTATDGSVAAVVHPKPEIKKETLVLRSYQEELAEEAVKGNNCLILAPTGSGKTHVALYISQNHFDKGDMMDNDRKIAFIVPTVALVAQQCSQYQTYMREGIKSEGLSGEETDSVKLPLNEIISRNDVIVMTPQILLNALSEKHIDSLRAFSLIIFDECHHTMKVHPYNLIMSGYVDELLNNADAVLPQIIGLTASPGVAKAVNKEKAEEHILQLCANMAAKTICRVEKNIDELDKHTNKPAEGTYEVKGRQVDPFNIEVCKIMQRIERYMIEQDLTKKKKVPTATLR